MFQLSSFYSKLPMPAWAAKAEAFPPLLWGNHHFEARGLSRFQVEVRIRGPFGDIDPLNKVPVKRAKSGVNKGPL